MAGRVARVAAPLAAGFAAGWWAFALTVLQPRIEAEQSGVESVGNNAYWVRDVRWAMILLVLIALVWACRGDRLRSGLGALGALVWVGADVWLDRVDFDSGPWSTVAIAGALAAAAVAAVSLRRPEGSRRVLILAACTAAVLAGLLVSVQSPTDTEAGLRWSGAVDSVHAALALVLGIALGLLVGAFATRADRPQEPLTA
ncbi:hypothetical protein AB0A73_03700 [Glycomyces sp. NPDC047369]